MKHDSSVQERILDAAIPLFAMKGYAGVSIRMLAEAANVNIAMISYYFGGKEGLYSHILSTLFDDVKKMIAHVDAEPKSGKEKIWALAERLIEIDRKSTYLIRIVQSEIVNPTNEDDQTMKEYISHLNGFLRKWIQEGKRDGDIREDVDETIAAINIVSMIDFYSLMRPFSDAFLQTDGKGYLENTLKNYFRGIGKE
ncbi:TetR family transcriptional regulator [Anaerotignum sp.]